MENAVLMSAVRGQNGTRLVGNDQRTMMSPIITVYQQDVPNQWLNFNLFERGL